MNLTKRYLFIRLHILKIGLNNTFIYFIQRIILKKDDLICLKLKNLNHKVYLRNKTYDTNIFYQIFIAEELNIKLGKNVFTIIDLGGNIGLSTLYLLNKFPSANILVVEPEDQNFELLVKNTFKYPNVMRVKTGVYGYETELFLIDVGQGEASYQVRENADDYKIMNRIKCLDLNSIIENFCTSNIDLVKMDIEGAEKSCLINSENSNWLFRTKVLMVEIHDSIHPGLLNEVMQKFEGKFTFNIHGEYIVMTNNLIK